MEAWTRVEITTGPDPYHLTGWAGGGAPDVRPTSAPPYPPVLALIRANTGQAPAVSIFRLLPCREERLCRTPNPDGIKDPSQFWTDCPGL